MTLHHSLVAAARGVGQVLAELAGHGLAVIAGDVGRVLLQVLLPEAGPRLIAHASDTVGGQAE